MGIKKHGTPEPILPDPGDDQKTASANFTEQDKADLDRENTEADSQ